MRQFPVIVGVIVLAAVVATAAWLSFRPETGIPPEPPAANGVHENDAPENRGENGARAADGTNGAPLNVPPGGQARVPEPEDLSLRTIEVLVAEKESERAIRALAPHIEKDPKNPRPRRLRGRAFLDVGDWRLAEREFETALGLEGDKTTTAALDGRAEALIHLRKTKQARELLDRSLELDPDRSRVHALLALSHLKDNDAAAAKAEVDRALELDPSDSLANGLAKRIAGTPR